MVLESRRRTVRSGREDLRAFEVSHGYKRRLELTSTRWDPRGGAVVNEVDSLLSASFSSIKPPDIKKA